MKSYREAKHLQKIFSRLRFFWARKRRRKKHPPKGPARHGVPFMLLICRSNSLIYDFAQCIFHFFSLKFNFLYEVLIHEIGQRFRFAGIIIIQKPFVELFHVAFLHSQHTRAALQKDFVGKDKACALVPIPEELTACSPCEDSKGFTPASDDIYLYKASLIVPAFCLRGALLVPLDSFADSAINKTLDAFSCFFYMFGNGILFFLFE